MSHDVSRMFTKNDAFSIPFSIHYFERIILDCFNKEIMFSDEFSFHNTRELNRHNCHYYSINSFIVISISRK